MPRRADQASTAIRPLRPANVGAESPKRDDSVQQLAQ
jgi:hypothetical protein